MAGRARCAQLHPGGMHRRLGDDQRGGDSRSVRARSRCQAQLFADGELARIRPMNEACIAD